MQMITRKTSSKKRGGLSALLSSAALCAFAAFFGAAPAAQGSTATVKGTFRCSYQQQVLTLVNQQRAYYGLSPLGMTKALTDVAMVRAAEISYRYDSGHIRPNGQPFFSIVPRYYNASENMAWGQTTPAQVMNDWMNSQLHREDILTTDCTYIGIGCFVRNGTYYWIQVFSDSPGDPIASETRSGDKSATATITLDTSNKSYFTITGSSSGGSSSSYCTISFNANGGKGKMAKQKVKPGVRFTLRKNAFTRSGYVFIGWAESRNGPVVVGNQGTGTAGNAGSTTLYAQWAKKYYKVAFYANGGKGRMAKQTMTYGKAAKLRANKFTRKGYTFQGWAKSKNGKVVYKNKKAVKNLLKNGKTVKLYAKWAKKKTSAKYCTITFKANGGTGKMAKQKVKMGTTTRLHKNAFKRSGYVFRGWSQSPYGYGGVIIDQASFTAYSHGLKSLTYYAIWKKK